MIGNKEIIVDSEAESPLFSDNELDALRKLHLISLIASQVPSKRSKTGHISREHVKNVLTGKDCTVSKTNDQIVFMAKAYLQSLNSIHLQNKNQSL